MRSAQIAKAVTSSSENVTACGGVAVVVKSGHSRHQVKRSKRIPREYHCPRCGNLLAERANDPRYVTWWECVECCSAWTFHKRELYRAREPRIQPTQRDLFD